MVNSIMMAYTKFICPTMESVWSRALPRETARDMFASMTMMERPGLFWKANFGDSNRVKSLVLSLRYRRMERVSLWAPRRLK